MASESSTERTMSITLPAALDDWLDEQAAATDVEREQLLVELLTAYRKAAELDTESTADLVRLEEGELAAAVEAQLENEQISAQLDERIDARIEAALDGPVTEQVSEAKNSVQRQLSNRIDTVETEFDKKIKDVRERVIQVKKETDARAPKDHTHPELQQFAQLETRIDELQSSLDSLRSDFEETVPDADERIDEASGRIEQMEQRLKTVAWVVSDLREAHESRGGLETVERIKRAAAQEDIERANCENCGDSVAISLLTDPKCPHCDVTVTNVEPAGGWFSKPKLLTAKQLESGEQ